ncbi:hypothetical protein [Gorillibacterium massiliense]|uniref:hypothetical protein n=1 Tax=Gorillibacterium massiliense TaxID=1280390 RepID=UPI0004B63E13|nr:hypothetical protein [Gorillibacterium massiliense]
MRWRERFAVATLLSVAIAASLSILPTAEERGGSIEAAGYGLKEKLTDSNLVDLLVDLPKKMEIRRASWNSPVLAVDYIMQPGQDEKDVLQDLSKLAQFSVEGTTNIDEIQARVYGADSWEQGSEQLLVSLNTRRGEAGNLRKLPKDTDTLRAMLEKRCRLSFTRKGLEMITKDKRT